MTRRTVLKGATVLAAYLAFPLDLVGDSKKTSVELFQEGLDRGVIEGVSFYFKHPIRITDCDGLTIRSCNFVFDYPSSEFCITIDNPNEIIITNCMLDKLQKNSEGMISIPNANISIFEAIKLNT